MSICIGQGGFANVYLQTMNSKLIACKKISLPRRQPMRYLFDQINAFRSLDHPNIVKLLGYRHLFSSFEIAFEYVQGTTIDEKYFSLKRQGLSNKQSEQLLFYWIFQITLALIEFEFSGIVHRDLKHRNILVNQYGIIKIIDFGISKILYNDYSSAVGTIGFMAPELILQGKVSIKSDVWSLGATIYFLIYEVIPFQSGWIVNDGETFFDHNVIKNGIKFQQAKCSKEMNNLLKMMLQVDPNKRIQPKEILNHPALKSRQTSFSSQYTSALNKIDQVY